MVLYHFLIILVIDQDNLLGVLIDVVGQMMRLLKLVFLDFDLFDLIFDLLEIFSELINGFLVVADFTA